MVSLPKDIVENLAVRKRYLRDGGNDVGAANELRRLCAEDILFWVNAFCWTHDPRKVRRPDIPFVTYEYQDEAIVAIRDGIVAQRNVGIEKSRDMGASWINLAVLTWFWQFWPTKFNALMVSRNEDYVDGNSKSLFWKVDFLLEHQPRWLLPVRKTRKAMHLENCDTGSVIDGESTTGEVARGDRRSVIFMDEYAAFDVKAGYNANTATQYAADCRIFNSTPRGVGNAFYDLMHNDETMIVQMHWSRHPEKNRGLYKSEKGKLVLLDGWRGTVEIGEKGRKQRRKVAFPEEYPFILDDKVRSPWYDRQCRMATAPQEDTETAGDAG